LLDHLGYKGYWHGSFGCYEKQPLVLVHSKEQAGSLEEKVMQFKTLITEICDRVQHTFQIQLEIEPQLLPYAEAGWVSPYKESKDE
jgi:UDP-N-acetylenolpyruvoylglucosamine reductase